MRIAGIEGSSVALSSLMITGGLRRAVRGAPGAYIVAVRPSGDKAYSVFEPTSVRHGP